MKTKGKDWSQYYKIVCEIYYKSRFAAEFGATKLGLARCLGASQGKTQNWEKGQWPSASDLAVIAERLGCSYRWLVTGEGDPMGQGGQAAQVTPERALRPVQLVSLSESDGEGWSKTTPMAVGASPVLMGENVLAVVASGESMVPAGIASGQICYCDPDQPVLEGDAVYVVRRDGLATIKLFSGDGQRTGTIRLSGWHPPDGHDQRKLFTLELVRDDVRQLVPVIYVRRRL